VQSTGVVNHDGRGQTGSARKHTPCSEVVSISSLAADLADDDICSSVHAVVKFESTNISQLQVIANTDF